eukprot:2573462-Rhodomonas_salina.2
MTQGLKCEGWPPSTDSQRRGSKESTRPETREDIPQERETQRQHQTGFQRIESGSGPGTAQPRRVDRGPRGAGAHSCRARSARKGSGATPARQNPCYYAPKGLELWENDAGDTPCHSTCMHVEFGNREVPVTWTRIHCVPGMPLFDADEPHC